jgi:hypothetical protein
MVLDDLEFEGFKIKDSHYKCDLITIKNLIEAAKELESNILKR